MNALELVLKGHRSSLSISPPMGQNLERKRICTVFNMTILNHELKGDLVVLEMLEYDVILGINFYPPHHAIIDYFKRKVKIHILGRDVVYFFDDKGVPFPCPPLN